MQPAERDEFNRQVTILCAAWNVPLGDRADTLWRAFYKLELVEFARIVDFAMSAEAEIEKFPTVSQLWRCRKSMRGSPIAQAPRGQQAALVEYVLRQHRVSERQKALTWNWITTQAFEILGVIVPQDPVEPDKHPAIRTMFADVDWQQYLEDAPARAA